MDKETALSLTTLAEALNLSFELQSETVKLLITSLEGIATSQTFRDGIDELLEQGLQGERIRELQGQFREANKTLATKIKPTFKALNDSLARGESQRDQIAAMLISLKKSLEY